MIAMVVRFGVPCSFTADFAAYLTKIRDQGASACQIWHSDRLLANFTNSLKTHVENLDISVVLHLDFWFNAGNMKSSQNIRFLRKAIALAESTNGIGIFHPGYYNNVPFPELKAEFVSLFETIFSENTTNRPLLALENDGNKKAIGKIEHLAEIIHAVNDERLTMTLDFGHFFARSNGKYPYTVEDFKEILIQTEQGLGYKPFLFHSEGIQYNNGSEVRHITLKANEPPFPYLCIALQELNYEDFTMILETPEPLLDLSWALQVWENPAIFAEKVPPRKPRDLLDYFTR